MHEQPKALDGERTSEWTRARAWAPECRLAHMARHMFVRRNNSRAAGRPGGRAAWRPPADERSSGRARGREGERPDARNRTRKPRRVPACAMLATKWAHVHPFGIPITETTRACCTARAPANRQRSAPGELGSPEQRMLGTPNNAKHANTEREPSPGRVSQPVRD